MRFPTRWLVPLSLLLMLSACDDQPPTGWLEAERVEFSFEGDASGSRLALNRLGGGMVVWEQRTGTGPARIHARAVEIDGAHGAIALLGEGSTSPGFPDVAINRHGHSVAVWTQGQGRHAQVWARLHHADEGWGPRLPVSGATGSLLARPRAAINEAGEVAVVWMQFADGTYHVHGRHFGPARGWSAVMRIDQAQRAAALPQVGLDVHGRWLIVWHQHSSDNTLEVWARTIDGSGSPSDPVQIAHGPGALPALATLGDGSTAVVWQRNTQHGGTIGLNRFEHPVGWGDPRDITDLDAARAHEPAVAAWGAQNAVLAWMQTRGDRIEVWATRLAGGQPDTPQALHTEQPGAQRQARIGAGDHGTAVGMWTRQESGARTLWATVWPASGPPGSAQRLDSGEAGTVAESSLAVDGRGNALAVWTQGEEGRTRLWTRRLRAH